MGSTKSRIHPHCNSGFRGIPLGGVPSHRGTHSHHKPPSHWGIPIYGNPHLNSVPWIHTRQCRSVNPVIQPSDGTFASPSPRWFWPVEELRWQTGPGKANCPPKSKWISGEKQSTRYGNKNWCITTSGIRKKRLEKSPPCCPFEIFRASLIASAWNDWTWNVVSRTPSTRPVNFPTPYPGHLEQK